MGSVLTSGLCGWVVMAMSVSPKLDFAFTVSADHQLVRYDLEVSQLDSSRRKALLTTPHVIVFRMIKAMTSHA
jgi:hypothetical protein